VEVFKITFELTVFKTFKKQAKTLSPGSGWGLSKSGLSDY
jgi:hypothetical protein